MKRFVFLFFLCILSLFPLNGCNKMEFPLEEDSQGDEWKVAYTKFLSDFYEKKNAEDIFHFSIKDLDNDSTPELIVLKNDLKVSVYTFNETVVKVGDHDFITGTTRLLFSDNPSYPGILYFHVGGGLEHYGYMAIKDNKLVNEELWNEDYSGISKELGEKRERIEEHSKDKQLIEESRKAYKNNSEWPFQELHPNSFLPELNI